MDFCPYGICIDYLSDRPVSLNAILKDTTCCEVKLFPCGGMVDDLFRIEVEVNVVEPAGFFAR